jgi:hypothetical protein
MDAKVSHKPCPSPSSKILYILLGLKPVQHLGRVYYYYYYYFRLEFTEKTSAAASTILYFSYLRFHYLHE